MGGMRQGEGGGRTAFRQPTPSLYAKNWKKKGNFRQIRPGMEETPEVLGMKEKGGMRNDGTENTGVEENVKKKDRI